MEMRTVCRVPGLVEALRRFRGGCRVVPGACALAGPGGVCSRREPRLPSHRNPRGGRGCGLTRAGVAEVRPAPPPPGVQGVPERLRAPQAWGVPRAPGTGRCGKLDVGSPWFLLSSKGGRVAGEHGPLSRTFPVAGASR